MLTFAKYEGAGNDFILIDDRAPIFDPTQVPHLCHRKFGIGADGLILLQLSEKADFRMRIFNSDGKEAESCGNGLRCLGRFITDLGLPKKPYLIATHDRIVQIAYHNELISVSMGRANNLRLSLATEPGIVHFANTGVPHAVLFVNNVKEAPLDKLGPFLRHHPIFSPNGANVNLAAIQPDGTIHVRTFERGVEAETLACGTGACAVAAIAAKLHNILSPIKICFPGGILEISFDGGQITMSGPANKVFSGYLGK